ncbi:hypothetical protein Ssi03_62770 [Sphaerisporangium siamense]|uniref:Fibronectin type-III domain-containing protein n=1 Tax=Sphaerisporangium siamense TaxID=795645 RepID=A0A7W7D978_9ACTN|nr:fibronectin type III domain-containing protein [Sphaerisporangium siamense]MBB4702585.1 hypothetical protein [Sphaerisporangium siamense]GII88287.1 hypothetical protein Ssi03_62770 [Sphaerisporangium siamense]
MSVTEVIQALGSWGVTLSAETPQEIIDDLDFFGHVAIVPGRVNPAEYGDNLLTMARYVGVLTRRDVDERKVIGGQGMAVWLGDADDKGEVLESPVTITGQTFPNAIRALLGSGTAVIEGTLFSVAGTYTGRHQWESRRSAIDYVCQTMGAEWRVNGNGTLDAGPAANLWLTSPQCVIVRKGAGRDLTLTGLPGEIQLTRDVEDWTSRVVLLAEGEGDAVATGSANIASNPYVDLRGQPVKRTRVISESGTATGNAAARAQLQLNRFTGTRNALRLSAEDYEIRGTFRPGDWVWVYDPESGLVDTNNEITFRSQRINPIKLRAVETTWPVVEGMTVGYRTLAGTWLDLTNYVAFEDGQTSITVGELGRSLTNAGTEPVGDRPIPDSTIPGTVTWVNPFGTSVYLDGLGNTRARIITAWQVPLNADGSTILDGDHYEIGYGVTPASSWETAYAAWGDLQAVVGDLSPGVTYDFRIRAVDRAGNTGSWSTTASATANPDTIPPSTPAPPTVAASLIAIQVSHTLGKASGGTFNLELDLDHLEVHVGASSGFTPDATTLRGKVPANAGMLQAGIAAVGTVPESNTTLRHVKVIAVDMAGNRSAPSNSATVTALLIDDAHITDLSVSKVTAGTVSANWLLGASIGTAASGARVELNATGLHGFNAGGLETVSLLNTGTFTLRTGLTGARVVLDSTGLEMYDVGGNKTVDFNAGDGTALIVGQVTSSQTASKRLVVNPGPTLGAYEPEIRLYEEFAAGEYHYWTQDIGGTHACELGSAKQADRKIRLRMESAAGWDLQQMNASMSATTGGYITAYGYIEMGYAPAANAKIRIDSSNVDVGYINNGNAFYRATSSGWLDFFGRLGMPGGDGAFARGNAVIPGGSAGASVSYGMTFTGGTVFATTGMLYTPGGTYAHLINGRTNSGLSFLANNPTPPIQYEISYFGWKQ